MTIGFPMEPLETARLWLRPLTLDDLDDLFELYRRAELMRYITGRPRSWMVTQQRLRDHIADHNEYGFGLCAALDKCSGHMIGRCGIEPVPRLSGIEGNIAWMFLPDWWNRGLATEFARAMIPYGFVELALQRITATASPDNLASIRVMEKAGMRFVQTTERGVLYESLAPELLPIGVAHHGDQ